MRIADLHCDTISALTDGNTELGDHLADNRRAVSIASMKKGGYGLETFAMYVDAGQYRDPAARCGQLLDVFFREMEANREAIGHVTCYEDIAANVRAGKLSALLSIEEGAACGGSLERLREYYRRGVRMMTLTWNYENELAAPNYMEPPCYAGKDGTHRWSSNMEHGLTELGAAFVEEMERLGMLIDLSHLGDKGAYDVLETVKGPVLASHSNARALCGHVRNLTDDMIHRVGERGGIVGVNAYPVFLGDNEKEAADHVLDHVILHMKHIKNVGGIDCVALGSDLDGMEGAPDLCRAEQMGQISLAMERAGFTAEEIEKVCWGNCCRLIREVCRP